MYIAVHVTTPSLVLQALGKTIASTAAKFTGLQPLPVEILSFRGKSGLLEFVVMSTF